MWRIWERRDCLRITPYKPDRTWRKNMAIWSWVAITTIKEISILPIKILCLFLDWSRLKIRMEICGISSKRWTACTWRTPPRRRCLKIAAIFYIILPTRTYLTGISSMAVVSTNQSIFPWFLTSIPCTSRMITCICRLKFSIVLKEMWSILISMRIWIDKAGRSVLKRLIHLFMSLISSMLSYMWIIIWGGGLACFIMEFCYIIAIG